MHGPPLYLATQELISYHQINASGLLHIARGAHGTRPSAHARGARVAHLAQMYGELLPRPDSTLFEEVAARVAALYNDCEFDMVYFDGSEGMAALGSEQVANHFPSFTLEST